MFLEHRKAYEVLITIRKCCKIDHFIAIVGTNKKTQKRIRLKHRLKKKLLKY